jgi:hypothetical protein
MAIILGPVLMREGGYAFDAWTPENGRSSGYIYPRIEDAYYARKAELRSPSEDHAGPAVACNTVHEFLQATTVVTTEDRLAISPRNWRGEHTHRYWLGTKS